MPCTLTPVSAFQSTNLNNKIECYDRLADRVVRALGAPIIQVELSRDQLYENISIAAEFFTRYAGYTKEFLVFNSELYIPNVGLRMDHLFTIRNPDLTQQERVDNDVLSPDSGYTIDVPEAVFIATSAIPASYFSTIPGLSSLLDEGIYENQIFDAATTNQIVTAFAATASLTGIPIETFFKASHISKWTQAGVVNTTVPEKFNNMFDYDVMDYRRVMAIVEMEEGSTQGINTLFTLEQTLAQQTYFSYAMGNNGFDMVSWYVMKDWMEMRDKLLSIKHTWTFDERTQIMQLYPEPRDANTQFYGLIGAYVERPLRDIIKEMWVYQYTLALSKIILAQIRGKYGNLQTFGGLTLNASDLMSQGLAEKEKLETMMYEGAAPGMSDAEPPMFFVG